MCRVNELKTDEESIKIEYLNIAKGIGIFFVVLGHCITKEMAQKSNILYVIRLLIYTIHMPLFFVIAGYLFQKNKEKYKKNTKKEYIIKKLNVFMIPYLAFSILNYAIVYIGSKIVPINSILNNQGYVITTLSDTITSILTFINHIDEHLWFCYVMFLILIINRVFLVDVNKKKIAILIIMYIIGTCFSAFLPDLIWKTMKYLLIFVFGRLFFLKKLWKKNDFIIAGILCILSFVILVFFRQIEFSYLNFIIELIVEITAAIIIFYISQHMRINKLKSGFKYLGGERNSYVIYLLHMPFLTSTLVFIMQKMNISKWIIIPVVVVVTIISVLLVYNFILSKIKFVRKIFFGSEK